MAGGRMSGAKLAAALLYTASVELARAAENGIVTDKQTLPTWRYPAASSIG